MRYSEYATLQVIILLAAFAVLAAVFLAVLGAAAIVLLIFVGIIAGIAFVVYLAWVRRAVDDFGGVPIPGIWGLMGYRILPDEGERSPPSSRFDDRPSLDGIPKDDLPGLVDRGSDPNSPEWVAASQPPKEAPRPEILGTSTPPAVPLRYHCARCDQVTEGSNSKFCRVCGSPLIA